MTALFLARADGPDRGGADLAAARAGFARQGLTDATAFAVPGWRGLHFPYAVGGPPMLLSDGDDLAAVAGTLAVDGLTGTSALRRLIASMDAGTPAWPRLSGHFAALVRRRGRTWLFGDYLGTYQLFHDAGQRIFSTSLLTTVDCLPRIRFHAQSVYEFAFNVTALGDDTVFKEVKLLGPDRMIELTPAGARPIPTPKPLPDAPVAMPLPERIERHRAVLDRVLASHLDVERAVHCPLSGGLDSRLLLAAIRRTPAAPRVYVYGPPGSADVRIARAIGAAQGFPVAWTDKQAAAIEPEAFPAMVARNFDANDGLPNFGNIFDNGHNLLARDARHEGGLPAASGGGGEVYRDFFYLPDRPLAAEVVARTFFARFVAADATALFDARAFLAAIRDKMLTALGRPGEHGHLPRAVVEQLYPRFRCRALFGREISLESRLSPWLVPFLDHAVVAEAATLPAAARHAGAFEAALLNAIDPALAAQPSAYGRCFDRPPSRRHRLDEWATRVRPTWVRQQSYALRRRRGPVGDEHGGLLDADRLGRVIDLTYPAMRRFFRVDAIADHGLRRRVACLEYLAGRLGGKLT